MEKIRGDLRLESIFLAAVKLPRNEQRSFILECSEYDSDTKSQILRMLDFDEYGSSILDRSLNEIAHSLLDPTYTIPDRIGRYRPTAILGIGGMGIVYRAFLPGLDRTFAIKVVQDHLPIAWRQQFFTEQRLLSRLEHTGIVQIYDTNELPNQIPYYVMEFVDGVPITTYCKKNDCSLVDRLQLFRQVCESLHFAHERGLIHRDIKPSNILVAIDPASNKPQSKLLDFGIAKQVDEKDRHSARNALSLYLHSAMTLAYAAPEQLLGQSTNRKTDIYSLGVLLYELLTDSHPWIDDSDDKNDFHRYHRIKKRLLYGTVQLPSTIIVPKQHSLFWPKVLLGNKLEALELDALCLKALNRCPGARFSSIQEILEELDRFNRQKPLHSVKKTCLYPTLKFLQRRYRWIFSLFCLLVVSVGGVKKYMSDLEDSYEIARYEANRANQLEDAMNNLISNGLTMIPQKKLSVLRFAHFDRNNLHLLVLCIATPNHARANASKNQEY